MKLITQREKPRRRLSRGVAAVACVSLVLGVTGCGGSSAATGDRPVGTRLGLVVPDSTTGTWDTLTDAAVDEGSRSEVDVAPDAADAAEPGAQISKLQAFAPERLDCFALAPVDSKALVAPLATIAAKKVPIFNVGVRLDDAAVRAAKLTVVSFIGPSDEEIGRRAAAAMRDAVPAGSPVAMVVGRESDTNAAAQRQGFREGAGDTLDVAITEATDGDFTRTEQIVTEALDAQPGLRGLFVDSDASGRAAAAATAELGMADTVRIVSVGGTRDGLKAVKSGELAATVATYPALVGQVLVRACRRVVDGKSVKPRVTTPSWLVTADNVDAELAGYPAATQPFPDPLAL